MTLNRRRCSLWLWQPMANEPETLTASGLSRSSQQTKIPRLPVFLILFSSFLAMIAAAVISVGFGVHRYWENVLREEIQRNLTEKARMFASRVNTDRGHKIEDITSQEGQYAGARATVIDANGKVVADSEAQVLSLERFRCFTWPCRFRAGPSGLLILWPTSELPPPTHGKSCCSLRSSQCWQHLLSQPLQRRRSLADQPTSSSTRNSPFKS